MRRHKASNLGRAATGVAACVTLAMSAAGCGSLSDSSASISRSVSDSISSPSESLSRSSSPEDAYRDDLRDFTATYLKSGGDAANLKREVAGFAQKRGVTDWESDRTTYEGVGAGLAKAGLSQAELEAYKSSFAGDAQRAQWMQDGYER